MEYRRFDNTIVARIDRGEEVLEQVAADFRYCSSAFSAVKLCDRGLPYSVPQSSQTAFFVQEAVPP